MKEEIMSLVEEIKDEKMIEIILQFIKGILSGI